MKVFSGFCSSFEFSTKTYYLHNNHKWTQQHLRTFEFWKIALGFFSGFLWIYEYLELKVFFQNVQKISLKQILRNSQRITTAERNVYVNALQMFSCSEENFNPRLLVSRESQTVHFIPNGKLFKKGKLFHTSCTRHKHLAVNCDKAHY